MRKTQRLDQAEAIITRLLAQTRALNAQETSGADERVAVARKLDRLNRRMSNMRQRAEAIRSKLVALEAACRAMVVEQGLTPCDHCWRPSEWTWTRTEADIKRMSRRSAKVRAMVAPESHRCDHCLPRAFPELLARYESAHTEELRKAA